MEFVELTAEEFIAYAPSHPHFSFLQCEGAIKLKTLRGWQNEFVGIKDKGEIIAAAFLTSIPQLRGLYRYYYAQGGLLIDYTQPKLVEYMIRHIKRYCRKRRGLYVRIDPNVYLVERDIDGCPIEDGFDNHYMIENMKKMGCLYCGEVTKLDDISQPRWQFVLDLKNKTKQQILKEMDQQTRWSINKTLKFGIEVKFFTKQKLPVFKQIMKHTSQRRGFEDHELSYYEDMMEAYGDKIRIPYAELDAVKYEKKMQEQLKQAEQDLAEVNQLLEQQPNSKKFTKRQKVCVEAVETALKRLQEAKDLKQQYPEPIILATALYLFGDDREMLYLFSGAYEEFMHFNGPYAIQWAMIQMALEMGFERYNFYGISGNFSEDADDYGVYLFKKGFNGRVEERVGDFILPVSNLTFKFYNRLKKVV